MLQLINNLVISYKPKNMRDETCNDIDKLEDYFYFDAPKSCFKNTHPKDKFSTFKDGQFKSHKLDIQNR
jgi:hypothetical protein